MPESLLSLTRLNHYPEFMMLLISVMKEELHHGIVHIFSITTIRGITQARANASKFVSI
jgi:hypothetical protein